MQVEYKQFLKKIINEWLAHKNIELNFVDDFQVLTPPENAEAFVGSNVSFILAKRILAKKIEADPIVISNELVRFHANAYAFDLKAAPSGYINAIPQESFLEDFFNKLIIEINDSRFLSFNFIESEKSILNSKNPDLIKLIDKKKKLNFNDLIMAFALLGDNELSVEPYLKNLNGSENIPWLLNRFFLDWRKIKSSSSNFPNIAAKTFDRKDYLGLERSFQNLESVFQHQLYALLSFRSYGQYERLFSFCLRIVRDFYRYYNQPYFRASVSNLGALAVSMELIGKSIETLINSGLREFLQSTRVLHIE